MHRKPWSASLEFFHGRPAQHPHASLESLSLHRSQRLLPRKDGKGRIAAVEILKSTMRTREYVEKGEAEGKSLLDAMRDGSTEGMQHFDGEIDKLIRAGIVDFETGLTYSTNAGNLRLEMADSSTSVPTGLLQASRPPRIPTAPPKSKSRDNHSQKATSTLPKLRWLFEAFSISETIC